MAEKMERTFRAPKGVTEFKTITIREVDGNDEQQAAIWAEQHGDTSMAGQFRELVRASIVAVDGEPVGAGGQAWPGYDRWLSKTRVAVSRFYTALNGIDMADVEKAVAEAMGPMPPTSANTVAPSGSSNTSSGG